MIYYILIAVASFVYGCLFSFFFIPFLDFINSKIKKRRRKKEIEIQFIKDLISLYPEETID